MGLSSAYGVSLRNHERNTLEGRQPLPQFHSFMLLLMPPLCPCHIHIPPCKEKPGDPLTSCKACWLRENPLAEYWEEASTRLNFKEEIPVFGKDWASHHWKCLNWRPSASWFLIMRAIQVAERAVGSGNLEGLSPSPWSTWIWGGYRWFWELLWVWHALDTMTSKRKRTRALTSRGQNLIGEPRMRIHSVGLDHQAWKDSDGNISPNLQKKGN